MPRVLMAGALAVVTAAALSLALFTRQSSAADAFVSVTNFQFSPASVTIDVGDSVTFSFDGGTHGVQWTGGPGASNSGAMSSGTFVFTPSQAGSYTYICSVHGAGMSGSVTVMGQQQPTATATNTSVPPTSTPTAGPPTLTPTNTATTAPATATPTATATTPAAATGTSTAGEGDDTATPTAAGATATATAGEDATTPAETPDTPDTPDAGDDDDGGTSWGIFIIGAVLFVAVVGGAIAVLGLRSRAA